MAVKGISIKVKARKPDTGKVVTVDDTEVFMDEVMSSPVGIMRFQEVLCKVGLVVSSTLCELLFSAMSIVVGSRNVAGIRPRHSHTGQTTQGRSRRHKREHSNHQITSPTRLHPGTSVNGSRLHVQQLYLGC